MKDEAGQNPIGWVRLQRAGRKLQDGWRVQFYKKGKTNWWFDKIPKLHQTTENFCVKRVAFT